MANFVYRLQALLEQREEALEAAQRNLAARLREMDGARETLKQLQETSEEASRMAGQASDEALVPTHKPVPAAEFLARVNRAKALHRESEFAKDEALAQAIAVQEAEELVDESRAALAEAMRAVEVLKKHKQRAFEKFKRAAEEMEALEMDEAGIAQFNRRGA